MVQGLTGGGGSGVSSGAQPYVMVNAGDVADLRAKITAYAATSPLWLPVGTYNLNDADLTLPHITLQGAMRPHHAKTPADGTLIKLSAAKRLIGGTGKRIVLRDLGIQVTGDYSGNTDSPIDFYDDNTLLVDNCIFYLGMTLANGHAVTPESALGGVAMMWGKSAGPSGVPSVMRNSSIVDLRAGTPSNTTLFGTTVEQLVVENNFWYESFANGLVDPRRFYFNSVTSSLLRNNASFKDAGVNAVYDVEYLTNGANKSLHFINNQFVHAARITTAHFKTNSTMFVSGENPYENEGGNVPILLSQSGTVTQKWKGRGYENFGTSMGTGAQQTIAHGLVTTPARIVLSELLTGGALARQTAAADGTNIYITATLNKDYLWNAFVL